MHEPINSFPAGHVIGAARLAKGEQRIDVTRLKYGSRTRFVEEVMSTGSYGTRRTAFRKSDDFPTDKIANRWISEWLRGITENREYKIIHKDSSFDSFEENSKTAT